MICSAFANGSGQETIPDFNALSTDEKVDLVRVTATQDIDDLRAAARQLGANVVIGFGIGDTLTLVDIRLGTLDAQDFVF